MTSQTLHDSYFEPAAGATPRRSERLIPIKAAGRATRHRHPTQKEAPLTTPFLTIVLAGYAAFMLVLGTAWLQQATGEARMGRAKRLGRR